MRSSTLRELLPLSLVQSAMSDAVAYGPRAEVMANHILIGSDRLHFLRQATISVLAVRLLADVADDRAGLEQVETVDSSCTSAAAGLYRHTLRNNILHTGTAARNVMSEIVDDVLRM